MALKYFKYFESGALADTDLHEDSWTPDEPVKLRRIFLQRRDGASYTRSTFYLKIAGAVYTDPVIPAVVLGPDKLTSLELDISIAKGSKLSFTLKNLEGVEVYSLVTFEVHEP